VKEGADHGRASPQATQGQADAVFEGFQIWWTLPGQCVLLHPRPQSFVGVQFWGVGGQTIDTQAVGVLTQGSLGLFRTVRVQAVPEQKDLAGNAAQEMVNKSDEFGTADRAAHETKIGMRVGGDGRKGRELGPIETVKQKWSVSPGRPGLARRGQQREAALVEKDQRGFQPLGVFFTCGQVCSTQRWMAPSSRSRARRAGFCQLQPKWCNRRQT